MAGALALALVGSVENSRRRRIDQEEDRQGREKDPPFYLRRDPETTNQSIQFFLFLFLFRFCCCFFLLSLLIRCWLFQPLLFFEFVWSVFEVCFRVELDQDANVEMCFSLVAIESLRQSHSDQSRFIGVDSIESTVAAPSMTSMNSFKHFRNRCWRLSNRWIYRPAAFVSWASPSPIDRMAPAEEEEEKDIFIGSYF